MNINKNHTPRNQTWNQYLSKLRRIQFLLNNNRTKDRRTDSHEPFTSKIAKLVGECFSSTRVPTCGHRWCGPTYGSTYGRELPEVGRVCFSLLRCCAEVWPCLLFAIVREIGGRGSDRAKFRSICGVSSVGGRVRGSPARSGWASERASAYDEEDSRVTPAGTQHPSNTRVVVVVVVVRRPLFARRVFQRVFQLRLRS